MIGIVTPHAEIGVVIWSRYLMLYVIIKIFFFGLSLMTIQ